MTKYVAATIVRIPTEDQRPGALVQNSRKYRKGEEVDSADFSCDAALDRIKDLVERKVLLKPGKEADQVKQVDDFAIPVVSGDGSSPVSIVVDKKNDNIGPDGDEVDGQGVTKVPEPQVGADGKVTVPAPSKNASTEEWRAYASGRSDVDIDENANRGEIQNAVAAADAKKAENLA